MQLLDAVLALLLAARIHHSDGAVIATAKRCAKRLPRSERRLMFAISGSAQPLEVVHRLARNLA
ncbi:MAG: hypothetical protein QM805_21135 [Pseudomonas sp.]